MKNLKNVVCIAPIHHVELSLTQDEVVSLRIALTKALALHGDISEAQPGSHIDTLVRLLQVLEYSALGVADQRYTFGYGAPLPEMRPLEERRREFLLPRECGGRVYTGVARAEQ